MGQCVRSRTAREAGYMPAAINVLSTLISLRLTLRYFEIMQEEPMPKKVHVGQEIIC